MFSIVDFKMLKNCSSDDIFVQFVWNYTYSSSFDFGENSTWVSSPLLWHEATEHQEVSVQSSRNLTTTVGSPEGKKNVDPDFVFETIVVRLVKWLMTENLTSSWVFCFVYHGVFGTCRHVPGDRFFRARISLTLGRFFMNWMWKIKALFIQQPFQDILYVSPGKVAVQCLAM